MFANTLSGQAPDISTSLVQYIVGAQTTDFTIDVTDANLLQDTTVKDFVVVSLTNNEILNNANFNKVSPTSIVYVGPDRAVGETLEVQRRTPAERYQFIRYKALFDSAIYNQEIERLWRRLIEAEVVGIGPGSGISTAPINEDYGTAWATDTFRSRVAKNFYDKFESVDAAIINNESSIATNDGRLSSIENDAAYKTTTNVFSQTNTFQGFTNFENSITHTVGQANLRQIRASAGTYMEADIHMVRDAGNDSVLWFGPGDLTEGVAQANYIHGLLYYEAGSSHISLEARNAGGSVRSKLKMQSDRSTFDNELSVTNGVNVLSTSGYIDLGPNSNDGVSQAGNWARIYGGSSPHNVGFQLRQGPTDVIGAAGLNTNGVFQVRADGDRGIDWLGWWNSSSVSLGWTGASVRVKIDSTDVGDIQLVTPSDVRFKKDVKYLQPNKCLENICKLKTAEFKWREDRRFNADDKTHVGFIAQDVLACYEDLTTWNPFTMEDSSKHPSEESHYLTIDYEQVVSLLTAAVQCLAGRVEALEAAQA
jgi:hypothetical protein